MSRPQVSHDESYQHPLMSADRLTQPATGRPASRHDCRNQSLATRIADTTHVLALTVRRQDLLEVTKPKVDSSYVLARRVRDVGRNKTTRIGQKQLSVPAAQNV